MTARTALPDRRGLILCLTLGLYGLACATPAVHGAGGDLLGLALLGRRWLAPAPAILGVPWSANVLFGAGLLCVACGRYRAASVLGWTAVLLGLTSWTMTEEDYLLGYYLWQASLVLLALGAGVLAAHASCSRPPGLVRLAEPDLVTPVVPPNR
jgi:hypothetical protein